MSTMLKRFITYLLSILFLIGTFHLDLQTHNYDYSEDYAICEISCDDNEHHSSPHLCEKCLNKNHRLTSPDHNDLLYNDKHTKEFLFLDQDFISVFSFFKIYSRPPPPNLI